MAKSWLSRFFGFGILNYLVRFFIGGVLFMGVKLNPMGFTFGFLLTATALLTAYLLLKFVIKPRSSKEALSIALVWAGMALILDIITAEPIVGVSVSYLLSEIQTWTRLIAIVVVTPFTINHKSL